VNQSGTCIRQQTGYKAFIPDTLPHNPPVKIEGELQNLLSKADRSLARFDGLWYFLPNSSLFIFAERLYFVVEAKNTLFTDDLRDKESSKITCGETQFAVLSVGEDSVRYLNATNFGDVMALLYTGMLFLLF
jgi:type III restriction enzyme